MKSMMSRPSQNLPAGLRKKVSPLGGFGPAKGKEAAKPPVSAFEAPKLKMAGKSQRFEATAGLSEVVAMDKSASAETRGLKNSLLRVENSIVLCLHLQLICSVRVDRNGWMYLVCFLLFKGKCEDGNELHLRQHEIWEENRMSWHDRGKQI